MDQPQRRQARRKPRTAEHRAVKAEIARAQHAARRGYAIRPEDRRAYTNELHRLRRHGLTVEQAWAELQPIFAQGARP